MTLGYSLKYPWGGETDFVSKILSGKKVHTIRKDEKGRWRKGNEIQHVTGNRTKARKQFYAGVCSGTQEMVIAYDERAKIDTVKVDGKEIHLWEIIAVNDGLSVLDFENWFYHNSTDGVFKGKIIHWTNVRY